MTRLSHPGWTIKKSFLQLPNYCVPHKKVYVTPISVTKLPRSLLNKMHTAWTLESICIVDNMWDVVPTTKDCYLLHWITCSGSKTAGSGKNTSNVLSTQSRHLVFHCCEVCSKLIAICSGFDDNWLETCNIYKKINMTVRSMANGQK